MDERPAILPKGVRELIEAVRMYLDTDHCVCEEEGECPPDCEKCMYYMRHSYTNFRVWCWPSPAHTSKKMKPRPAT